MPSHSKGVIHDHVQSVIKANARKLADQEESKLLLLAFLIPLLGQECCRTCQAKDKDSPSMRWTCRVRSIICYVVISG
ncbi:hypothetical protein MLD38_029487 [Melastoma candidum]|uniref:Uncharacterized protein n=1 Tax=Melastoma candidum TaxID=119954 RepID=A0ACB9N3W0_9MYRT|nr:hypothetical protein MLD38_029487 [Melastoma candidum]